MNVAPTAAASRRVNLESAAAEFLDELTSPEMSRRLAEMWIYRLALRGRLEHVLAPAFEYFTNNRVAAVCVRRNHLCLFDASESEVAKTATRTEVEEANARDPFTVSLADVITHFTPLARKLQPVIQVCERAWLALTIGERGITLSKFAHAARFDPTALSVAVFRCLMRWVAKAYNSAEARNAEFERLVVQYADRSSYAKRVFSLARKEVLVVLRAEAGAARASDDDDEEEHGHRD